jgi:hypothetical protein
MRSNHRRENAAHTPKATPHGVTTDGRKGAYAWLGYFVAATSVTSALSLSASGAAYR